ncbi:hypothetical protein SAY87_031224 [Trapa incisa]|uniref:Uncharacterized protein n=1 Tax=Trapa incisa TaxID=236973 RepID=A0AAN7KX54_9MYRT|nr:hypothetical protein SAY87_031224 [Trapa incisa]
MSHLIEILNVSLMDVNCGKFCASDMLVILLKRDVLLRAIGSPWSVPWTWTAETVLKVMVLCLATFWFIGTWLVPFAAHMAGFNKEAMSSFRAIKGSWHLDLVLGCLMFPIVNRLSQFILDIVPLLPSTPLTLSNIEQSIFARDQVAMALYAVVVTVPLCGRKLFSELSGCPVRMP